MNMNTVNKLVKESRDLSLELLKVLVFEENLKTNSLKSRELVSRLETLHLKSVKRANRRYGKYLNAFVN